MADNQNADSSLDNEGSEVILQLYCQFCGEVCYSFVDLEKHIETEHKENEQNEVSLNDSSALAASKLDTSGKASDSTYSKISGKLDADYDNATDSKANILLKCQFCNQTFCERDDFEKHIEEGHDPFQDFTKTVTVKARIIKVGKKEYRCPYCEKIYTKHYEIMRHMLNSHENEVSSADSSPGIEYTFSKCEFCGKVFTCESELNIHRNRHTRKILYSCPFCPVVTSALKDTFQHMKRMHGDKPGTFDKNSVIKLDNPNSDGVKDFLKSNVVSDTTPKAEESETSNLASQSHFTKETLKMKIIASTPQSEDAIKTDFPQERPKSIYKCPYCTLATHYSCSLKKHMKLSHATLFKPEDANEAKKYLLDPSQVSPDIVNSIKTLGDKEINPSEVSSYYQCPFCTYKCIQRNNVVRHLQSKRHAAERKSGKFSGLNISELKVQCEKKDKAFSESRNYFQCPFCSYRSVRKDKIVRHLKSNKHLEETKSGQISKLDIAKLRVSNETEEETSGSHEISDSHLDEYSMVTEDDSTLSKDQNYDIVNVKMGHQVDKLNSQVFGDKVIDNEVNQVKIKVAGFLNQTTEEKSEKAIDEIQSRFFPDKEQEPLYVKHSLNLPKDQQEINCKERKLPTKVPNSGCQNDTTRAEEISSNTKTTGNSKDEPQRHSMSTRSKSSQKSESETESKFKTRTQTKARNLEEKTKNKISEEREVEILGDSTLVGNTCPHCGFQSKRTSALKFHINFNHKNIKSAEQHDLLKTINSPSLVKSSQSSNVEKNAVSKQNPIRLANKKSNENAKFQQDSEEIETHSNISKESSNLKKRKLDTGLETSDRAIMKKSRMSTADTAEIEKEISPKKTCITDVDGTVIEENINGKENQEYVNQLSLLGNNEALNERSKNYFEKNDSQLNERNEDILKSKESEPDMVVHVDDKEDEEDTENQIDSFLCPYCKKRFRWLQNIQKHIAIYHPTEDFYSSKMEILIEGYNSNIKTEICEQLDDKYFKCPFCSKHSHWIRLINYHVQTNHKDKEFKTEQVVVKHKKGITIEEKLYGDYSIGCSFCDSIFYSIKSMKTHIKDIHPKQNTPDGHVYIQMNSNQITNSRTINTENVKDENDIYTCPYCEQILEYQRNIEVHMQVLHPEKLLNPEVMEKMDKEKEVLKDNNHSGFLFGCPKCDMKFQVLKSAVQHLVSDHGSANISDRMESYVQYESETEYMTDICADDTGIDSQYKNVMIEMLKCPFCSKCCEWMGSIKRHIADYHKDKTFVKEQIEKVKRFRIRNYNAPERFQCPACPLQLRWKHSILKHARKFHADQNITSDLIQPVSPSATLERYLCPYCPLQFKWRTSIARHVSKAHQDKSDEFSVNQIEMKLVDLEDAETGDTESGDLKDTETKTALVQLEDREANKLQICECSQCFLTFGSYASLWKHNYVCHNVKAKPYKCSRCPKTFKYQHQRQNHEKTHFGLKRAAAFSCDHEGCDRSFTEKRTLYNHLRKEHGEKDPVQRFRVKAEKKQFTCEDCAASFTTGNAFWRHMISVHNKEVEKPYECKVCLKTFLRPHDLKDHMFVHISTADLKCPIEGCLFLTKKLKYLSEHIGRQHGVKIDSRTLGKHFLSEKQMSSEELLGIFSVSKSKETAGTAEGAMVDEQTDQLETEAEPASDLSDAEIGAESGKQADETFPPKSSAEPGVKRYKCQSCEQIFPSHRRLIKHRVEDHPEAVEVHRCGQCSKTFFTAYDLKEHKTWHHPTGKPHVCRHCGKRYPILSGLHQHMRRHLETPVMVASKNGEVVCDICGLSLRYRPSLLRHIRRAHPEKIECECKICTGEVDIDKVQVEKDNTVQYCNLCDRYFCKKIYFYCHMKGAHNTTGRYKCNYCPEMFSTKVQKRIHMHQTHSSAGITQSPAEADSEQISTNDDNQHIIEISNDDQKGPKFLPKLSEPGLKAVAKELKVYVEETSGKHWKCLLCGQCFSKVKYFNMHVRRLHVRAEHQPFRCKICGAGFARVAEFRKHTRSHSGFRPLTCGICQKSFKQQCHLKEHLLIHSSYKSYKCEICKGRYKQRGALLAHVVRHDKLKPYKCHFCGIGFTIRGQLSKHMKKYLENAEPDTHLCHICHKTFQYFPLLLKHIQSHQEPNPFSCSVCQRTYAAYTSLYDHKVKAKHFLEEEYETNPANIESEKGTEANEAVGSLIDAGKTGGESANLELEIEGTDAEAVTDSNIEPSAVEIIIQEPGNGEHTTYKVESHTDVDILSIAKQLTEMSGSLGQEIFIEEVVEPNKNEANDVEAEIMMNMLEADDDVRHHLEKNFMVSKPDAASEQTEGIIETAEKMYVQISQSLNENEVSVEHEGENDENLAVEGGRSESLIPEYIDAGSVIEVEQKPVTEVEVKAIQDNEITLVENEELGQEEEVADTDKLEIVTNVTTSNYPAELMAEGSMNVISDETQSGNEIAVIISATEPELDEQTQEVKVEEVELTGEQELEQQEQSASMEHGTASIEIAQSDMYEPPVLQTVYIDQSKAEEEAAEQNTAVIEENETNCIIPVSIPENVSQSDESIYMLKKADGSLVYICVTGEAGIIDNNEIINAALQADVYLEEQDTRDDSTLEAAEILKSVAGGSAAVLEQVEEETAVDDMGQGLQIQVDVDDGVEDVKPVHAVNNLELELSSMRKVIKTEASEKTVAYECNICGSLLKSKKNLRHHLRRHARGEDRPFGCRQCNKRFVSNSELNRHMRVHTDYRPCACDVCGRRFRQPGHLMAHKYIHTGQKPYACHICPAKFRTSTLLKCHILNHSNIKSFRCEYCKRAYKTMRELTSHRAVHSGLVGKNKIKPKQEKQESMAESTVTGQEDSNKVIKHICYVCGKGFSGKMRLDEHIAAHENLRSFICEVCGQGFNTKSAVESHQYSHTDERPEICSDCGLGFKNRKSLKQHQKVHKKGEDGKTGTGEPRYSCPACHKAYNCRSTLYYHIGSSPECMAKGMENISDLPKEETSEN